MKKVIFTFAYPEDIKQELFSHFQTQFEFIVNQKTGYKGYNYKLEVKEIHPTIETLDITAKDWFDKANGNSYFSARIIINAGIEGEKLIVLPFQYGYDEHYIEMARQELVKQNIINMEDRTALWRYCKEKNIILRTQKIKDCKKRDVKDFGIE